MEIKNKIINDLDLARLKLISNLGDMDQDREVFPGWRIKNFLDHISGWDELVIKILESHRFAKKVEKISGLNEHNAESVANRESLSYEESLRDFEKIREQLKQTILDFPFSLFEEPINFPWGGSGNIQEMVAIFSHHELEHEKEIKDFLKN
ncbi:MAG: hypothetical protein HON98_12370 [Chloroflexi bacterium]|jgi:hypothetical protein|nr:hypothetical protein [Chloroflexota bacterium]MBT3669247.1 hypothetical protein [Chloroflexota bacterium]MBT4003072.1 hypothetical protein [Chloroflexota bacterium]MBT4305954.1 hypothetical protein [Chloroflexota bacterium]MBT4532598.1 hypothetical protein [Chloroflexota bacterium]